MRNRIAGLIAPKGSGKTHSITQAMKSLDRVAAFDMNHEFQYLKVADELFVGQPKSFAAAIAQEQFRIVYRPITFAVDEKNTEVPSFHLFAMACYLRGNMTIIVDEAHLLCNARTCPRSLYYIVTLGRHRGINLIYAAQRFSQVARIITANTDEFLFWRIIEPADLTSIRDRFGAEAADIVANLRATTYNGEKVIPGEIARWTKEEGMQIVDPTRQERSSASSGLR